MASGRQGCQNFLPVSPLMFVSNGIRWFWWSISVFCSSLGFPAFLFHNWWCDFKNNNFFHYLWLVTTVKKASWMSTSIISLQFELKYSIWQTLLKFEIVSQCSQFLALIKLFEPKLSFLFISVSFWELGHEVQKEQCEFALLPCLHLGYQSIIWLLISQGTKMSWFISKAKKKKILRM